ncbi:MAG TPA: hypothetical protein DCS43_03115 [Verrucomicrobia bacterium]|nr:hypothetical protein [Verrucomicrobiota bacterium]
MSKRKKALIIDDDVTIQKLLVQLCLNNGVDADAVSSFSEIETMLSRSDLDYDIYFVDLVLPQVSGWEIIVRIREMDHIRDKPVVVISGAKIAGEERQKLLQKANYVMLKQEFSVSLFKRVLLQFLGAPEA